MNYKWDDKLNGYVPVSEPKPSALTRATKLELTLAGKLQISDSEFGSCEFSRHSIFDDFINAPGKPFVDQPYDRIRRIDALSQLHSFLYGSVQGYPKTKPFVKQAAEKLAFDGQSHPMFLGYYLKSLLHQIPSNRLDPALVIPPKVVHLTAAASNRDLRGAKLPHERKNNLA